MNVPTQQAKTTHPTALMFIFWGEFAERCSYYGMRAILFLYMTKALGIADQDAGSYYSIFKAACYLLPLLGGYLADRFLGKYWTIVGFTVPYIFGQFLLLVQDKWALAGALVLLACGSGVIKPNISSLLGMTYDQQRPGNTALRAKAFLWFYFSINVGALLSMFLLPLIREKYGYQVAFSIPAVLMICALAAFALGKRFYAIEKPGPQPELPPEERAAQTQMLLSLMGVFALIVLFWLPYEQNDTLWIAFADKHLDRSAPWMQSIMGIDYLPADWFQWVNSLMVLILIVFFQWFWARFDPKGQISPIRKMSIGFLFTFCGPAILAYCSWYTHHHYEPRVDQVGLQGFHQLASRTPQPAYEAISLHSNLSMLLTAGGTLAAPTVSLPVETTNTYEYRYIVQPVQLSYWPLVIAYLLLTIGEVLVYGTGLDFSYGQAPATMKSTITAVFLLTNAIANTINTLMFQTYERVFSSFSFYTMYAALPLVASVLIIIVGRRFHQGHGAEAR